MSNRVSRSGGSKKECALYEHQVLLEWHARFACLVQHCHGLRHPHASNRITCRHPPRSFAQRCTCTPFHERVDGITCTPQPLARAARAWRAAILQPAQFPLLRHVHIACQLRCHPSMGTDCCASDFARDAVTSRDAHSQAHSSHSFHSSHSPHSFSYPYFSSLFLSTLFFLRHPRRRDETRHSRERGPRRTVL